MPVLNPLRRIFGGFALTASLAASSGCKLRDSVGTVDLSVAKQPAISCRLRLKNVVGNVQQNYSFGPFKFEWYRPEGSKLAYYDPNRQGTIILIHGWNASGVREKEAFDFRFSDLLGVPRGAAPDFAAKILEKGWNVGVLNWLVTATRGKPWDVEEDIWNGTMDDAFVWFIKNSMRDFKGAHFRIAGHSLGSQMAARLLWLLAKETQKSGVDKLDKRLVPQRLAFLDPFFSNKLGQGKEAWPGYKTREAIKEARAELADASKVGLELYSSSGDYIDLFGDSNDELQKMSATMKLHPEKAFPGGGLPPNPLDVLSGVTWNQATRIHFYPVYYYLHSLAEGFSPTILGANKQEFDGAAMSAARTDDDVLGYGGYLGDNRFLDQVAGTDTIPPEDDKFVIKTF